MRTCKAQVLLMLYFMSLAIAVSGQEYAEDHVYQRTGDIRVVQQGRYGLLNNKKEWLIPAKYELVGDFQNGLALVQQNGKTGFVNVKNEWIIPCMYDPDHSGITGSFFEKVISAESPVETIVVGVDPDRLGFQEGLTCDGKNGRFGYIDTAGKTVLPFEFEGGDNFFNGMAVVKKDGLFGVINRKGIWIIPLKYELIVRSPYNSKQFYTQLAGKIIWLDL